MKELDDFTIKKAARGDQRAFKNLYDLYAPFLWKVAFRTVNGDEAMARDIVQETFVKVYHALKSFKYEARLSTWLFRIGYNVSQSYISRQKKNWERHQELDDTVPDTRTETSLETKELVQRLLKSLTSEERYLLTMVNAAGVDYESLSSITGKSAAALRTQVSRIKDRVRQKGVHYEIT